MWISHPNSAFPHQSSYTFVWLHKMKNQLPLINIVYIEFKTNICCTLISSECWLFISFVSVHLLHEGLILFTHWKSLLLLLFDLVFALSHMPKFWHPCLPRVSLLCKQKKKKRSIEENEENCNLNIHKALCLFPPICVRERSCYSAVDFGNYLSLSPPHV